MSITATSTATLLYTLADTAGGATSTALKYYVDKDNDVIAIRPEDGDVRVAFGVVPTSSLGTIIKQGTKQYLKGDISTLKVIRVGSSNVVCEVTYFVGKGDEPEIGMVNEVTLDTSDIEIGAVELKDGTTDTRGIINAANTARAATDQVVLVQALNAAGGVLGTAAMPVTFSTSVLKTSATGAGAMNTTTAIAAEFRLVQVTCHFSAAPTTSENFVIKLDSSLGAAYDTPLFTTNPSLSAATDISFVPDSDLDFFLADEIVVTFTNTDARTFGLTIYYETI